MNAKRFVAAVFICFVVGTISAHSALGQQSLATQVQAKMQLFQQLLPGWVAAGGDPQRIAPLAQRLDGFLKAGDLINANATLDAILAILTEATRTPTATPSLTPTPTPQPVSTVPKPVAVRLGTIPFTAQLVYHFNGFIYVMNLDGSNATQITFQNPRDWEHVAVSFDHRRVVANARGPEAGDSCLWLFDLQNRTEVPLVPQLQMAGNGGVDWDSQGYVYFAAVESVPVPNPVSEADFIANKAANDIYKVRYDGTGLKRLTNTTDRGEADVSTSADGKFITYMAMKLTAPNAGVTEIWMANSDGTNRRLVYTGGPLDTGGVHDPEFSPDNRRIVFSQVNPNFTNFPSDPNANTAEDLYTINIDGTGLTRVTQPGPISIIPDWKNNWIVYMELADQTPPYLGISLIRPDGTGHTRIRAGANTARFIP